MKERSNQDWLSELRSPDSEQALTELSAILLKGLQISLGIRFEINLEPILEDFVQEALIKILANLDGFRGESRFITWAQKIATNVAYTELRRRRWQNVSLQDMIDRYDSVDFTPPILTDRTLSTEKQAILQVILQTIDRVIQEELTDRQSQALRAVVFGGAPLEEVARRMGTNRNALYKLLHDARKSLKSHLLKAGLTPEDVLEVFDDG